MKFKPLGKRVLLKRQESSTATKSGIILTQTNEKSSLGTVLAVGEELINNSDVLIGSTVAFKEYKTNEVKIDDKEYLVVEFEDLLGVVNN